MTQQERNAIRVWAAFNGEEHCVTIQITAV